MMFALRVWFLVALLLGCAWAADDSSHPRFKKVGLSKHPRDQTISPHATPWYEITLPDTLPTGNYGDIIEVELTDDLVATCVVTYTVQHPSQRITTFEGSLTDASAPEGTFILSCKNDVDFSACFGNIRFDADIANQWELRPRGRGQHAVRQINVAEYEETEDDTTQSPFTDSRRNLRTNGDASAASPQRQLQSTDTNNIVDILVLYSADAVNYVAGDGEYATFEIFLAAVFDESNQILKNSNVNMRLRMVHAAEVVGGDESSFSNNLNLMENTNDGVMDFEMTTLRDQYGADQVSYIAGTTPFTGSCGIARLPATAATAITTTHADCATGYFSFLHELGHNMGLYHDFTTHQNPTYPYAHGWCWQNNNYATTSCTGCQRSILAYSSCVTDDNPGVACQGCTRVAYASNPDVYSVGYPTGRLGVGENARLFNEQVPTASNWRSSLTDAGLVFSVLPNIVEVGLCSIVTIDGWALGTGSDIISVTLAGEEVTEIVSQTEHTVVVRSPLVLSSATGNVVITTSAGVVTEFEDAFTFSTSYPATVSANCYSSAPSVAPTTAPTSPTATPTTVPTAPTAAPTANPSAPPIKQPEELVPFAVLGSAQCAELLPYGPSDISPTDIASGVHNPYFSTSATSNIASDRWWQVSTSDGITEEFTILWQFDDVKTVTDRIANAVTNGEGVDFTVYDANTNEVFTMSGTWWFSDNAGSTVTSLTTGSSGTNFSGDDGVFGAAAGTINGDGSVTAGFWGHGNFNSADGSYCFALFKDGQAITSFPNVKTYMYTEYSTTAPNSQVVETAHPYLPNTVLNELVQFPGATCYKINFDPQSNTASIQDFLHIRAYNTVDGETVTTTIVRKLSGNKFRRVPADFEIQAESVRFYFKSDGQDEEWGFKVTVEECH